MKRLAYLIFNRLFILSYNYKDSKLKSYLQSEIVKTQLAGQEKIYDDFREKYNLDESFRFNGKFIQLYGDGIIQAGAGSYIGSFSTAYSHKGNKIIIGRGVRISHNVRIYTLSSFPDQDFSNEYIQSKSGDVMIGDFSWIGANVFINPGIKIGSNAIVGANSVITKDVPDFAIVGGVPAALIRMKRIEKRL